MLKVDLFFAGDLVGEADEDDIEIVVDYLSKGMKLKEFIHELDAAGHCRKQAIGVYREAQRRIAEREAQQKIYERS